MTQNLSNPQQLYHAIAQNNVDNLKKLIPFFDLTSDNAPLRAAAELGFTECLELLIPVSDCTAHNNAALCLAAKNGHTQCVEHLIPVSNPHCDGIGALHLAAEHGHAPCVQLLVSHCEKTNMMALFSAALKGHAECVKILLPMSDPQKLGAALEAAARGGYAECVSVLLPVAGTDNGALKQALINERAECAEILYPHYNIAQTLFEVEQFYAKASSWISRTWVDEWLARKQHDIITAQLNDTDHRDSVFVRARKI